jgi:carboxymethylenebutenolidase
MASMGDYTTLMARDGHEFQAWLTPPSGPARGAIVVLQEIFGLNAHVREVTDRFAADGYLAIAPALFDRVRRGVELGYTADTVQEGRGYVKQIPQEKVPVACAVAYYGTAIAANLDRKPKVPVMYHFGERDRTIPPEAIERIREAHPEGVYHVYPADHGFSCDHRAAYDAASAELARKRTLEFLAEHVG